MPVDRYRITGPEETQCPLLFQKPGADSSQLINKSGKRKDGRGLSDVRSIFMKAGVVSQAQGSAYVEIGSTKVLCAVYGPRAVLRREDFSMTGVLKCNFKFATFSCPLRRQFQADSEEQEFALVIEQALSPAVCLHKFPKSQVEINIRVLENDGSALAASIMCSSLALADAAIEMYDIVAACSLGVSLLLSCCGFGVVYDDPATAEVTESFRYLGSVISGSASCEQERLSKEDMLLDPTYAEETTSIRSESHAHLTVGLLPSINQTSALYQHGHVTCDAVLKAIQVCTEGAQRMYPLVHECIRNSVKNKHQTQKENSGDRSVGGGKNGIPR